MGEAGDDPFSVCAVRASLRGDITASDASEWGGGFCVSNGLTPMGVHAASCQVRGGVPEVEDHVQALTIGLFIWQNSHVAIHDASVHLVHRVD